MLSLLALAAEEPAKEEEFSLVAPHISELIWAAVFFIALFLVISRVALPKLNATLAAREQAMAGQLRKAEEAKTEADQVLAEYRAKLADAQSDAQRIIDEGRRTAEGIVAESRTRAEAEAQTLSERARADIAAERDRAIGALRSELAGLSIDLASRVVGQSLDTDAQRRLVDSYIEELTR